MKISQYIVICFSLILVNDLAAEDQFLLDPRKRDEDISHTKVSVEYKMLPNGLYEYLYDIVASNKNKAIITSFSLGIACEHDFGFFEYGEEPEKGFSAHAQAVAIPVQAYVARQSTYYVGVSVMQSLIGA